MTVQNGKKLLSYAVLQDSKEKEVSSTVDKSIQSIVNLLDRQNEQLSSELNIKNRQLEAKDEQIKELNARLAETTAALVTAQQTAQAAQALHAGTIRQQIESGGGADPAEPIVMSPKKQSFFARFFTKNSTKE